MSKYRYKLFNYRAVQSAEIDIDGITVLAGENGTGKSTLTRWLYNIVKVLSEYEVLIDNDARNEMLRIIRRLERIANITDDHSYNQTVLYAEMRNVISHDFSISDTAEKLCDLIEKYIAFLSDAVSGYNGIDLVKRLATLFDVEGAQFSDERSLIELISKKMTSQITSIRDKAQQRKSERKNVTLKELLPISIEDAGGGEVQVGLSEDGVELLGKDRFNPTLNINKVIYYKTYELLDYLNNSSDFNKCLETSIDKMTSQEELIYKLICKAIGGNITMVNDGGFIHRNQLHYNRHDGLDIPLRQAATGLVSFSYLARLLENGYLRKGTLLIIDEPEAHLHPRWIVEYARILVLLQKMLDLKIVLSTHNPDMVAAIDAIARKEKVLDNTNFYFARPSQNADYKFVFEKQDSIGEIFDSFNIALTNIQAYGDE